MHYIYQIKLGRNAIVRLIAGADSMEEAEDWMEANEEFGFMFATDVMIKSISMDE